MITGKNYIGNQLVGKGSKTYKTFNPQLNIENETVFTEATPEEIDEAVSAAANAFETYKLVSGKDKARFLNAIADEILALGDQLIETYRSESGLPSGRAKGELGRTIGQLRGFATHIMEGSWVDASIDTAIPDRKPLPKVDLRKVSVPLGPIVVFGASNFPFAFSTAGGDTASALASGCPVIVKSHPMHAGTGELIASAIIKAANKTGMPEGVFSNLNSSDIQVGQQLVQHPSVKGVGFTGSLKGGRALFDLAGQRPEPIPVFAEMGSINPVVILAGALAEKAEDWAKKYASSITLGAGQFCTNPGLILGVKGAGLSTFIDILVKEITQIDPICMLHPNINMAYRTHSEQAVAQAELEVVAQYEGEVASNYAQQTVAQVNGIDFIKNRVLHQEVFGPFSIVVACKDELELEEVLQHLDGQLTGTIIGNTNDINQSKEIVAALQNKVGRIIFNGVPTGVEVCPSMLHGGPYPASTDARFTAVGVDAIERWVRPFSYQNWPQILLPDALKDANPLGIERRINGVNTRDGI